ncbi:MAG: type I-E CRISPR-associated protein Cas7/Cse4/CasC [Acidobacteriota bacterium]
MTARFLQIHTLTSFPATLLNRDDAGQAKRLPFGGTTRTRISSQCLKRHWRTAEHAEALRHIELDADGTLSIRSRETFDRYLVEPLEQDGVHPDIAEAVTQQIMDQILGLSAATKTKRSDRKKKAEEDGDEAQEAKLTSGQVTVLGHPEVRFLREQARAIIAENELDESSKKLDAAAKKAVAEHFKKGAKKNLQELSKGTAMGLDAAMFGRMVTSDILARGDAAIHVAHAFTVHAEDSEPDYFSAVDDLVAERGDLGAGHINTSELTSGLYYGYVVVDVPLLVSNLTGAAREEWESADRDLAGEVTRRLVHTIATVSPGAKLGSTAPYARPHLLMIEADDAQPRTLANAFLDPVAPSRADGLLVHTFRRLAEYVEQIDGAYGGPDARRLLAVGPVDELGALGDGRASLADLAGWAGAQVRGAA